jgi:lysophospholipase L1-like esterase
MSACAVGEPRPRSDLTDTSVTLNANVFSTLDGPTDYWFRYGAGGDPGTWSETPRRTLEISDREAHPVSEPISGLTPDTDYGWVVCVADREEDPPREICSKQQAFQTRPAGAPPRLYVAIGDSVTQIGSPQRYPERFFSYLDAADQADVLSNLGQSGETSEGLNEPGHGLEAAQAAIEDPATDTTVATFNIGANDILVSFYCDPTSSNFDLTGCQSTLDEAEANIEVTFEELNSSLANDPGREQLIVMAYYNPWSGREGGEANAPRAELALLGSDHALDCAGTGEERGLNDRIACLAATNQAGLADAYPPFVGHGELDDYFADAIHPNGTGHQVIADVFAQAFEDGLP